MMNNTQTPSLSAEALLSNRDQPKIYGYTDNRYEGCIKVGYTTRPVAERVAEQYPIKTPSVSYQVIFEQAAIRDDGSYFRDGAVHAALMAQKVGRKGGEWFECDLKTLQAAFLAVKTGTANLERKTQSFGMRPEQAAAVAQTAAYFEQHQADIGQGRRLHYLWNAKMRFGKTFAAYQLAKRMGWKKLLIITFKPAVESAWYNDLTEHQAFEGWQYQSKDQQKKANQQNKGKLNKGQPELPVHTPKIDPNRPIVCFASFQDLLGKDKETGANKANNEWIHAKHWDCILFDEYHFGSWRDNAKELFAEHSENGQLNPEEAQAFSIMQDLNEARMAITCDHFLYLSGTPFRALKEGEFTENEIFNWTYTDEQRAKAEWPKQHPNTPNPYASLPKMVMMTYQLPEHIQAVALDGEFNGFALNTFFEAKGTGQQATFTHENAVQQWLDLLRGQHKEAIVSDLKQGKDKAPMPFADARLLANLAHTFWFLPNVAACHAMKNLMNQAQNVFYQGYTILVAAGNEAGLGLKALNPIKTAIGDGLNTKTITLSCGKLNTGVSVPPWSGILMLRDTKSPETYFQTAFRVQTPWQLNSFDVNTPEPCILKHHAYILDFSPNRAFAQMAEYAQNLDSSEPNPEKRLSNLLNFLPVLAYEGGSMMPVDAGALLDKLSAGTSSSMLAKRWSSANMVNVDNGTLERILNDPEALAAIMKIEGFRALGNPIGELVASAKKADSLKPPVGEKGKDKTTKKIITVAEKEAQSKRKQIRDKLIKFATRIPVFMYVSDYREYSLHDVITQLEPKLFTLVTGLTQQDFELLVDFGVFNAAQMNLAIEQFKRFEDASLDYTGVTCSNSQQIGLYDIRVQH
jgi:hypothetical protein